MVLAGGEEVIKAFAKTGIVMGDPLLRQDEGGAPALRTLTSSVQPAALHLQTWDRRLSGVISARIDSDKRDSGRLLQRISNFQTAQN